MPQEFKKYLNPMQDGRRKLDPALHPEIIAKYTQGGVSWQNLADEYGVNKGTIGMIVSKNFRDRVMAYRKGRWKIYADKDHHREAMQKYRAKKRTLQIETKKLDKPKKKEDN